MTVKETLSDSPYHFPPELTDLLIDTIPLLCRSKTDVLTFFRGCGIPDRVVADLRFRVQTDRERISKYEITRTVLTRINESGDVALAQRREVIKRVTGYEDFSTCWPSDQLKAQGLVTRVRAVVNVKDAFTRMQQAEESHRLEEMWQRRQAAEAKQQRRDDLSALRGRLARLSSIPSPQQRGLALEAALNDLFKIDSLKVREAFTIRDEHGRVQEQIDGLIALDGRPILVEAKWLSTPIGQGEISRYLVRVYGRAEVMGLFVSSSPYTDAAIAECKTALSQRVIVLAEVSEIILLLEDPGTRQSRELRL